MKFSCWRAQGWQYWFEKASRGAELRFAPPRWTSVPANTTQAPSGISSASAFCPGRFSLQSAPQRWLPANTSVAPFSCVNASTAAMVESEIIGRGMV